MSDPVEAARYHYYGILAVGADQIIQELPTNQNYWLINRAFDSAEFVTSGQKQTTQ